MIQRTTAYTEEQYRTEITTFREALHKTWALIERSIT
jgi:hypothetical protein